MGRLDFWSGFRCLFFAGLAAAVLGNAEALEAQESVLSRESARVAVIDRIAPSVVCVMASSGEGGGSGVLISSDGYAISNYHVTSGSGDFMKCGLNDGRVYDAVIVGIDPTGDVALIQLQGRSDFTPATAGNSDQVQVGDEVMALGNPFLLAADFSPTVTYGIVSGVRRYQYPANTFLEYTDCIQIDASINPGNSGGPLFDINGNWIGINGRASFEKRGRVNSGAAYAISVNQVLKFVDHLKCGLIVDHGQADFTVETSPDGEIVVSQVSEVSEAWRRGLRPRAQLVSFAGRIPTSANDFQNVLGIYPDGSRVPLTWRDKEGLHSATIRLTPLHGFTNAPPLPEERQPRRPDQDPDQDDSEKSTLGGDDDLPKEVQSLFIEREGFANFFYNQKRQTEILDALKQRTESLGDPAVAWQIQFEALQGMLPMKGELAIGPDTVGLRMSGDVWLQKTAEPSVQEEPQAFPGLLIAMSQIRKLLSGSMTAFNELLAAGSTVHLPTGNTWRVLLTREGTRTCRWYFDGTNPMPAGLDLEYASGTDEIRLLFDGWEDRSGTLFPGKIGIVNATTEQIEWLTVTAAAKKE